MKQFARRQMTYLLVLIVLIIWIADMIGIRLEFKNKYNDYLGYSRDLQDSSVKSVLDSYESFANFIFYSSVDKKQIQGILYAADSADESQKKILRSELYKELRTEYELMQQYHFNQLHFQLTNGESFIRFNNLTKYGDDLFSVRKSIRVANIDQKYISGFEIGRNFTGYRYVFPMSDGKTHVGSVEISASPICVLQELYAKDRKSDLGFILDGTRIKEVMLKDQMSNYDVSVISDQYLTDKAIVSYTRKNVSSLHLTDDSAFTALLREKVAGNLKQKQSFGVTVDYQRKVYLIQFSAVYDISGLFSGYLYSMKEEPQIESMEFENRLSALLSTLAMMSILTVSMFGVYQQKVIERVAMTDQLTGLFNRHSFYIFAEKEVAKAKRTNGSISIAILDIDSFKSVNDNFGHSAGDETLRNLSRISEKSIREVDVLARYGGEEFVILMPDTPSDDAVKVMERLRISIEEKIFPVVEHITVSIGITEMDAGEHLDDAINRADQALYVAKGNGKNQVIFLER